MKKLLILIAPTSIRERFTRDVRDWSILNSEWPVQKTDFTNISMEESMPHCIPRLVKNENYDKSLVLCAYLEYI